jgi:hypothetical protein
MDMGMDTETDMVMDTDMDTDGHCNEHNILSKKKSDCSDFGLDRC